MDWSSIRQDDRGKLHAHVDGATRQRVEHRHFAEGFTIGGQVIPDDDGSGPHTHGTVKMKMGGTK